MAVSRPLMTWLQRLWLLVPVFALVELLGHCHFAGRAPALEEWQANRPAVVALREHEEPLVVAPYWAEPMARQAFGSELFPVTQLARPDMSMFGRAIEVSILGQHAPELVGWRVIEERRVGGLGLRVVENPNPARVSFDFWSELGPPRASVSETGRGDNRTCGHRRATGSTGGLHGHIAFPAERFQCPSAAHVFVGKTIVDDQNYHPRRCLWAHPPEHGELVVHFDDVPLGGVVKGYGALSWFLWRDGGYAPVELEVQVNGESIGKLVHRDEQGWNGFEFPTGRHAGTRGTVEFRVRSERADHRDFCFWADTR